MKTRPRIAIFHDYFGPIGGAEKLVVTLAKALKADIITTDMRPDTIERLSDGFHLNGSRFISVGETIKAPIVRQIHASWRFARCLLPDYDFHVMTNYWTVFAAARHKPNLYYCNTPVRMFYDAYDDFRTMCPPPLRPLFSMWARGHGFFVTRALENVQSIVANSENCRRRVRRYYGKDAKVIYPPVDTNAYRFRGCGDFWLSVNRLYPHKRIHLQTEVFRNMPDQKLYVVGGRAEGDHSLPYAKKVLQNLPPNVEYLGEVSEKELRSLYGRCRGFITTSQREDFGMTPVEAMAAGKPVVATAEGGHLESIVDGETGRLVPPRVEDIIKAVREIGGDAERYRAACEERASKFDTAIFVEKMKKEIECVAAGAAG